VGYTTQASWVLIAASVVWSFVYLALRRSLELVLLCLW
jgi:hypothetical protein